MTGHSPAAESLAVGREVLERVDAAVDKYYYPEVPAQWAAIASAHFLAAIAAKLVEG